MSTLSEIREKCKILNKYVQIIDDPFSPLSLELDEIKINLIKQSIKEKKNNFSIQPLNIKIKLISGCFVPITELSEKDLSESTYLKVITLLSKDGSTIDKIDEIELNDDFFFILKCNSNYSSIQSFIHSFLYEKEILTKIVNKIKLTPHENNYFIFESNIFSLLSIEKQRALSVQSKRYMFDHKLTDFFSCRAKDNLMTDFVQYLVSEELMTQENLIDSIMSFKLYNNVTFYMLSVQNRIILINNFLIMADKINFTIKKEYKISDENIVRYQDKLKSHNHFDYKLEFNLQKKLVKSKKGRIIVMDNADNFFFQLSDEIFNLILETEESEFLKYTHCSDDQLIKLFDKFGHAILETLYNKNIPVSDRIMTYFFLFHEKSYLKSGKHNLDKFLDSRRK